MYSIWADWARLGPPVARLDAVELGGGRRTPFSIYVFPIYCHYPSYRFGRIYDMLEYFDSVGTGLVFNVAGVPTEMRAP